MLAMQIAASGAGSLLSVHWRPGDGDDVVDGVYCGGNGSGDGDSWWSVDGGDGVLFIFIFFKK